MKSRETVNKLIPILIFVYFVAINDLIISPVECVPLLFKANTDPMNDVKEIRKREQLNDLHSKEVIVGVNNGSEDEQWPSIQRSKRSGISDQRLSELETLLALKRLRDYQRRIKQPIAAYGLFDPDKIGKRKRRSKDMSPHRTNSLLSKT